MKLTIEQMIDFEEKYDLKNRNVLGFYYWDYMRIYFLYQIKIGYNKSDNVVDTKIPTKEEKKIDWKHFNRYIPFTRNSKTDIVLLVDPRKINQDGKYENVFIDKVQTKLEEKYSCLALEEPNWSAWNYGLKAHFTPNVNSNINYVDFYELSYFRKKRLFMKFQKSSLQSIEKEFYYLAEIIEKEFYFSFMDRKEYIINLWLYFLLMRKKYLKLIKKINPKIMLVNYRPTNFKTLITSICNELNITTVELQHGVISKEEPLDRKIKNGHNWLTTPNYLFAFGEKLVNFNNLAYQQENVKYVGYSFLEDKVHQKLEIPSIINDKHKYILVISQSIMGDEMTIFTSKLAHILETVAPEYKIIYKYHPNEIAREYPILKHPNIIEIKDLRQEIYQFHKYCVAQIGVYSTGVYEGLSFKLPTFIINDLIGSSDTLNVLSFMTKGVYSVDTPEDIISLLQKGIEKPIESEIDLIWKKDSLNNILKEVDLLINKKTS